MGTVVLDAGSDKGGREAHNAAGEEGIQVTWEEAHGSQGRPEDGQEEDGLGGGERRRGGGLGMSESMSAVVIT